MRDRVDDRSDLDHEGDILDRHRADCIDASARSGRVVVDGGVGDGEGTTALVGEATATRSGTGGVVGDRGVGDAQGAGVRDAASLLRGIAVLYGHPRDVEIDAAVHGEDGLGSSAIEGGIGHPVIRLDGDRGKRRGPCGVIRETPAVERRGPRCDELDGATGVHLTQGGGESAGVGWGGAITGTLGSRGGVENGVGLHRTYVAVHPGDSLRSHPHVVRPGRSGGRH